MVLCRWCLPAHPSAAHLRVCVLSSPLPSVLQGLKARNFIHSKIEENIRKKLEEDSEGLGCKHRDALQQLIDSSKNNAEPFSMQVGLQSTRPTEPSLRMRHDSHKRPRMRHSIRAGLIETCVNV